MAANPKESRDSVLGTKRPSVTHSVEVGPGDAHERDVLTITPLGAGNEVGRSSILLQFKGKVVLLDCGVHPGYTGLASLPYFDEMPVEASEIDILLITHFHLDHAAALPYFTEQTSFKGRIFMTHPTKAILKMQLGDFIKVSNIAVEEELYTKEDLNACLDKVELIDFHQERVVNGIKFKGYNAGHVLGAAMFMIEIAGVRILYTGDYSCVEDRHLMAAEVPADKPEVLIVESTYGVQVHEPRVSRENHFTGLVQRIVSTRDPKGGRCLIPVFALGRAQELLLILDEHWKKTPVLHRIPIFYVSSLARKCMNVFKTYVNMMNKNFRKALTFGTGNPFDFVHISNLDSLSHFADNGPCVVMASPGMMQNGISRELFERWCGNRNNGVVIPGYCVEGTLAKTIMSEPKTIKAQNGRDLPLQMSVHYISFSAHADYAGTSEFIDALMPPYIVLVHGDRNQMNRLRSALIDRYDGKNVRVFSPKNTASIRLLFRAKKMAKVVGKLAEPSFQTGKSISGIFVQKTDYSQSMILAPSDLSTYTQLTTSEVCQEQVTRFEGSFSLLHHAVASMYDDVRIIKGDKDLVTMTVHDQVTLVYDQPKSQVTLHWQASPMNDMMADSLVSIIIQTQSQPSAIRVECAHLHGVMKEDEEKEKLDLHIKKEPGVEIKRAQRKRAEELLQLLQAQFGKAAFGNDQHETIELDIHGELATVHIGERKVDCKNAVLQKSIENALIMAKLAIYPLSTQGVALAPSKVT